METEPSQEIVGFPTMDGDFSELIWNYEPDKQAIDAALGFGPKVPSQMTNQSHG